MQFGTTFTLKRVLTQDDFNRFAALSGDNNPIHVDPAFSARTAFGKTVAHGMFLYSLIHRALEQNFPGAAQVSQDLMFPSPSFVGEEVTVSLKVIEIREPFLRLETMVSKPNGEIGLQGETTIRIVA
ncbi:MAG: MaoC family dehydratase [Chloroflexi bacterium]|nr:MaoC family dehydratase [Chloroflexota bacterium]